MSDIKNKERAEQLLSALGEQLAAAGQRYELGSAKPLPANLEAARDRVARDFSLPADWLNPGPADLLELGLPGGSVDRLERRDYGDSLGVRDVDLGG